MKLQILVPQYKETETIIKPLLDSIELQQGIDIQNDVAVIIVSDGGLYQLSEQFLNNYSYPIEYHIHEHSGVSSTRNACLDYATADYVMFCDADDMFYSNCGLHLIFKEIDELGGFDTLSSMFIEENRNKSTNKPIFVKRENDSVFVHGKVHNRKFLVDNNIRWNPKLTIHEDSYFHILCQTVAKNAKYSPTPFYLWKWRDDSVCRRDPKYILKTYTNLLDSSESLVDELIKRNFPDKAQHHFIFAVFDAYYTMQKPQWQDSENKEYRKKTEKRFAEYFIRHKKIWEDAPDSEKLQVSNGVRARSINEGMKIEDITIDKWLKNIQNLI
jgi:glycosyltransferase involved in cell wall biosynthesis